MTKFYAQPSGIEDAGFSFETYAEFEENRRIYRNGNGETADEYDIKLIDGERLDAELADIYGLNQANIAKFIEQLSAWDEHQKVAFILAVRECAFVLDDYDCNPDELNLDVYEARDHEELGAIFMDNEELGPISKELTPFIDYTGVGLYCGSDYDEADVAGNHYFFRAD